MHETRGARARKAETIVTWTDWKGEGEESAIATANKNPVEAVICAASGCSQRA